ncbi:MAG: ABC transporter ATP-binding protein [Actinobacteria bacterium]|nr:MAG: ABC transporter ATP-binding protein [Actinomycetota bacterium]
MRAVAGGYRTAKGPGAARSEAVTGAAVAVVDTTAENIAHLHNVTRTYHMGEVEIQALRRVDLTIKRGEFLVVLGPSGSGKTTLLNLLGGLDVPTTGEIIIDGVDISKFNERQLTLFRRQKIGFIFQFFNLIPTLTAKENVEFAVELASRDGERPARGAIDLLTMVDLAERADHFPYQLSGGEQQRVAIARSLAKDPALILGDEPTGNLDFKTGKLVFKAMKELNEKENKTFVIVTHNAVVGQIAHRILHLHDGRVASEEIVEKPISPEDIAW